MNTTWTLVNVTRKPQFVIVDGVLRQLPEAPSPRVIEMTSTTPPRTLTAQVDDADVCLAEVEMIGGLVSAPPIIDSVLWLVDTDVFSQFPARSDFIRPAAYTLVDIDAIDCTAICADVLDKAALVPGQIMVLTTVSRSPHVAAADAARLQDLDVDTDATDESNIGTAGQAGA